MKWSVDFSDDVFALISRIAKEQHLSDKEVLRRAIALYSFLHDEGVVPGGNKKVIIADAKTEKLLKDVTFD